MNGKKIGVWGGDFTLQPLAFITKYRLDVKLVNQPYSVNLFLRDGVAVTSAMWYNEYHVIIDSGYNPDELVTFFFSDHDLNFPEDGIYCLDETYARAPELCMNFTAASLEGWRYAFDHPDEALEIIMKYVGQRHLRTNRAHQKWMLDRMKDIILLEMPGAGKLNRDEYVKVCGELRRRGFIHEVPEYEGFYKDCVVHVPR
jgi:NitT/TauT family transport system substrate-binding protein